MKFCEFKIYWLISQERSIDTSNWIHKSNSQKLRFLYFINKMNSFMFRNSLYMGPLNIFKFTFKHIQIFKFNENIGANYMLQHFFIVWQLLISRVWQKKNDNLKQVKNLKRLLGLRPVTSINHLWELILNSHKRPEKVNSNKFKNIVEWYSYNYKRLIMINSRLSQQKLVSTHFFHSIPILFTWQTNFTNLHRRKNSI